MICQDGENESVLTTEDSRQALVMTKVDGVLCEVEAFRDEILGRRDHRGNLQTDLRALDLVDEGVVG
jgi:hypothetical protein